MSDTTETTDKLANARSQAKAQYDSIAEMVAKLRAADDDDAYQEMAKELAEASGYRIGLIRGKGYYWAKGRDRDPSVGRYDDEDGAWLACCDDNGLRPDADETREAIQEDPLSVQVRSGWYNPGDEPEAEEYEILLCTGGPAVRIIGTLGQFNTPDRARLECQDWFTPWTEVFDGINHDILLAYAQQFYFGE